MAVQISHAAATAPLAVVHRGDLQLAAGHHSGGGKVRQWCLVDRRDRSSNRHQETSQISMDSFQRSIGGLFEGILHPLCTNFQLPIEHHVGKGTFEQANRTRTPWPLSQPARAKKSGQWPWPIEWWWGSGSSELLHRGIMCSVCVRFIQRVSNCC